MQNNSKPLLSFALVFSLSAYSCTAYSDAEKIGTVYPIKEQSMLEYIMQKLKQKEADGDIEKMQDDFKKQVMNTLHNPVGISLPNVKETNERIYDTTVTINQDIPLPDGGVLYKAGTKFNPLLIKGLSKKIIFIDGSDKSQVEFAVNEHKKSGYQDKIILVSGSYLDLMKEYKVRFFFDQSGSEAGAGKRITLVKKFGIKALPSVVYQKSPDTPYLTIKEVAVHES
jgi:conjugal transfer pilus assembly protein TraW